MNESNELLILALGNPTRGDDGLGPQFIDELKNRGFESPHFNWVYQLSIEDAETFSRFHNVLIVDAKKGGEGPFSCEVILPDEKSNYSTHVLRPQNVLALTQQLYQATPKVHLLAITGLSFELSEELSSIARVNLTLAVSYFSQTFRSDIRLT